ncbi:MAG: GNAT family N-acetyltransferase [Actinomycetota bacterium]|nr:GNAT family N-acetyltransferase [Actinomycetota bacterium]MDQ3574730.1 GNAT family N-acetyltransferase [Actinomycetota bacterium]
MISRVDDTGVIRWGREQVRAGPWQGDSRVAYLVPFSSGPTLSVGFVRWAMAELGARGFSRVVTNALAPVDQVAFLGAGFEVQERLHLLSHDLQALPEHRALEVRTAGGEAATGHRRARPSDHPAVLDLDARAFPAFWRLDAPGLDDALAATPRTRLRVITLGGDVVAYALTGRAGRRGFLQRLAVDPVHRRQGLGRELVLDALEWLRRRRVGRVVVNTPAGNEAGLALYQSLGFRRQQRGLSVLGARLGTVAESRPWAARRAQAKQ